jgi:hypothetical protein
VDVFAFFPDEVLLLLKLLPRFFFLGELLQPLLLSLKTLALFFLLKLLLDKLLLQLLSTLLIRELQR